MLLTDLNRGFNNNLYRWVGEVLKPGRETGRPGGPSPLGGSGGMSPRKILKFYTLGDAFSCILGQNLGLLCIT